MGRHIILAEVEPKGPRGRRTKPLVAPSSGLLGVLLDDSGLLRTLLDDSGLPFSPTHREGRKIEHTVATAHAKWMFVFFSGTLLIIYIFLWKNASHGLY